MAEDDPLRPWTTRWSLDPDGEPIVTPTSVVRFVSRAGERLALKLVTHEDEAAQAAALAHFAGEGAVRLVARDGPAMLLERARPGEALSGAVFAGRDDDATAAAGAVMARLHVRPAPAGFRTVEDWGRGFVRLRDSTLATGLDAETIGRAAATFADLCASQGPRVLLHGDLHHDNILFDEARGWLAIDPKGVVGEPAYEAGALLRNPGSDPALYADPRVIERRASILCERLGFDRRRVIGWCFAQAALSALWSAQDRQDPARGARAALASQELLAD